VLMFFADPAPGGPQVVRPGWTTQVVVGLGVVTTVAFGVFPGPLLDLAKQAGEMLR
jgi:NADH-quinone oxidoreductase subunit N